MLLTGISLISLLVAVVAGILSGLLWVAPLAFLGAFILQAVLIFVTLVIICACVDLEKVQETDDKFFRWIVNLLAEAAMPVLSTRVHTSGTEQIPADGRFLLVCNHISDMDPVVLLRVFRDKQLCFISKRENDRKFIVGPLLHKIGCQPINRENDREALKTILRCVKMIENDAGSIAVFPEGYTSKDGLLHHFRHGAFKIAQKTHVPVVVCTLRGTEKVFHNAARLKRSQVQLHLVGVISPAEYAGKTTVELGQRVYEMMARDLGPELVAQENT